VLNYPSVCFEIRAFLTYLIGVQLFSSPTPSSPAKAMSPQHPSKKFFEQRAMMTFDRRLANITGPVVRIFIAPPLNVW